MSDLVRSLRLFLRLAEQGSFSALARQQHLSHTTVSRAIDELEAHFGVRLFHRSTRRLTLTGDGEHLLEHAAAIVDRVSQAEAELAGAVAVRGLVRIGVTTALGLHYAQRMANLRDAHPGLSVELLLADWRDAAEDSGLDLWIAVGPPAPGTMPLGELPRVLVAAPAYLAARGMPASVDELPARDCLGSGYAARAEAWTVAGRAVIPGGFLRANSSEAVRSAVRGGLGIGLLPRVQVADDLAQGALVRLLPDAAIAPVVVSLGNGFRGMRMPARVRVVMDFLVRNFPGG